jgi:hypothetical protein
MRKSIRYFIALGALVLLTSPISGFAQDSAAVEKKTPDLGFVVKRITGGDYLVTTRVSWYENRKDNPVKGVPVTVLIGTEASTQITLTATTDEDGYGISMIKAGANLPKDAEGKVNAKAVFDGNSNFEAAEAEVSFIEVNLKMSLELVDSVKTVILKAFKLDAKGKESPLEGESVTVSVQRMLSRLPVGDISIDAEGNGSLEFPADLPGTDSLGTLEVIASISENESYGNVETVQNITWGKPKVLIPKDNRTLWSHIAPVWMIISLTIMLIGVWAHYLYVVIQLIRVKIKGNPVKE